MIELVNDQILVIKLIRTDTTLDLSQKAEKNGIAEDGEKYLYQSKAHFTAARQKAHRLFVGHVG